MLPEHESVAVGAIDAAISPLDLESPVEPLDLPVLPGAVRPDQDVGGADLGEGALENGAEGVVLGVVGHPMRPMPAWAKAAAARRRKAAQVGPVSSPRTSE